VVLNNPELALRDVFELQLQTLVFKRFVGGAGWYAFGFAFVLNWYVWEAFPPICDGKRKNAPVRMPAAASAVGRAARGACEAGELTS
jgi:hypothetical protein